MKRLVVFALICCLGQGYAFGQKYQRPQVPTPKEFRADPAAQPDPQTIADMKWFELFKDEKLRS
jgi:hypothetical protein